MVVLDNSIEEEDFKTKILRICHDTLDYITVHKKEIILLIIAIFLILYPIEKYNGRKHKNIIQKGGDGEEGGGAEAEGGEGGAGKGAEAEGGQQQQQQGQKEQQQQQQQGQKQQQHASPGGSNSILNKITNITAKIGGYITRVITVITGIFLVFGLITLPFVLYAVVFYNVLKKGIALASKL
jgi:hypothetical protein